MRVYARAAKLSTRQLLAKIVGYLSNTNITGFARLICFAAGLHDVGKFTIDEAILEKPGKLDPEEWEIMRRHAKSGHEILSAAKEDPVVTVVTNVALRHHEYSDGSGYPDALRRDNIPREARIVGLGDVYDATRETRLHKRPRVDFIRSSHARPSFPPAPRS